MAISDCNNFCLKLPRINKCCFCIDIKKGSSLIAVFLGFQGIIRLSTSLITLLRSSDDPDFPLGFAITLFTMSSINFLCVFLFIVGMVSETTWLILPLLYADIAMIILLIMLIPFYLMQFGTLTIINALVEVGE